MSRIIIKLDGKYLEWSTIPDAPVTYGRTLEEFKQYYSDQYGPGGRAGLEERLKRVEETGTSSVRYKSVNELIEFNRAGRAETRLTVEQIIGFYCCHPQDRRGGPPEGTPVGYDDDEEQG